MTEPILQDYLDKERNEKNLVYKGESDVEKVVEEVKNTKIEASNPTESTTTTEETNATESTTTTEDSNKTDSSASTKDSNSTEPTTTKDSNPTDSSASTEDISNSANDDNSTTTFIQKNSNLKQPRYLEGFLNEIGLSSNNHQTLMKNNQDSDKKLNLRAKTSILL